MNQFACLHIEGERSRCGMEGEYCLRKTSRPEFRSSVVWKRLYADARIQVLISFCANERYILFVISDSCELELCSLNLLVSDTRSHISYLVRNMSWCWFII